MQFGGERLAYANAVQLQHLPKHTDHTALDSDVRSIYIEHARSTDEDCFTAT
jgi:hypothetical protein